jgi:hypothetical protein
MQFNYGNSANYLAGGAQVANTYLDTYDTSQKTGTDVNKLVQAQSKRRKQQEINAINQVTTIGDAAVDIQTGMKIKDMDAKLKKDIRNINRPAKMAGALAATVNLGNTGLMLHQDMKRTAAENAEKKRIRAEEGLKSDERSKKTTELLKQILESQKTTTKPTKKEQVETPDVSGTPKPSSSVVSAAPAASKPYQLSKPAVYKLAVDQGFTPAQAGVAVGIAGGESGRDPTNSTIRSGLSKIAGEDSVGLMQINWGYHKDSGWLQKLGITKREDLFDPVKNMKAAKYLFDGRGNFRDWTVYNKGTYKDNM